MRAKEFIFETTKGAISKRASQSSRGINTYGDAERINSDYVSYRLGMAVAEADGINPIQMDGKSWMGKQKSAYPYSKEEQAMLKQAYKAVGAKYTDVNHGDMRSLELDSTNVVSPVIGFKGFSGEKKSKKKK